MEQVCSNDEHNTNDLLHAIHAAYTDGELSFDEDRQRFVQASLEWKLQQLAKRIVYSTNVEEKKRLIDDFETLVYQGVGKCYHSDRTYSTPSLQNSAANFLTDYYLAPESKDDFQLGMRDAATRVNYMNEHLTDRSMDAIREIVSKFDPKSRRGAMLHQQIKAVCDPDNTTTLCTEFFRRFPGGHINFDDDEEEGDDDWEGDEEDVE